jgi:hypothetical protein
MKILRKVMDNELCPICQKELTGSCFSCENKKEKCEFIKLSCGHKYHLCCIFCWTKVRNTCPIDGKRANF